jgi:DNA-binding NarL/FixJ family response regulator
VTAPATRFSGDRWQRRQFPATLGALRISRRELEILRLLAAGRSQKQIAAALVISSKTVAIHLQHVLSKLGVHSRAEAVAAAYRLGLVDENVVTHAIDTGADRCD